MINRPRLIYPALLMTFLLVFSAVSSQASQVTTERIITLPDYSASSQDLSPDMGPNGEGSGESRGSVDGEITGETSGESPEHLPEVLPETLNEDGALSDSNDSAFSGPPPAILRDIGSLPAPVQSMYQAIYRAALTGKIEALRLAIEMNEMPPILGLDSEMPDPIDQIKQLSGDPDGAEILAILAEILESGFVLADQGTPQEMYVWPYFANYPLTALNAPQRVELFRLITAGDYEEMDALGQYIFYRIGIAPDGTWHYFVAGE